MKNKQETWNRSWGHSGQVGEWCMEVPGAPSENLTDRFQQLTDILKKITLLLQQFHTLHKAEVDISILGETVLENGEIEEKQFLESVELDASTLEELVTSLKRSISTLSKYIVTQILIDLNTIVKEENGDFLFPNSADIYVQLSSSATIGEETEIYICYSTYLDVWLKKTFKDRKLRDNSQPAFLNHLRLEKFLLDLEKTFETSLTIGESYYYSDYLQKTGFRSRLESSGAITSLPT